MTRRGAQRGPVTRGAARTPAVRRKPGRKLEAPRKILLTSFKAEGSIRSLAAQIYGGYHEGDGAPYAKRKRRYAVLQSNYPAGYPESPGVWTSVEGKVFGTVNFPGYVSRKTLIDMLNKALSLDYREVRRVRYERDAKGRRKRVYYTEVKRFKRAADFRDVYPNWSAKWQVVEVPVVSEKRMKEFRATDAGKPRVIASWRAASR